MFRKNGAGDPCNCLMKAFSQLRCGDSGRSDIRCCCHDCPIKHVDTSVVYNFLDLIATAADEPETSAVLFFNHKMLR